MTRNGKVVIRPDSGNPIDIICGTIDYDLVFSSENKSNPTEIWEYWMEMLDYITQLTVDPEDSSVHYIRVKLDDAVYRIGWSYENDNYTINTDKPELLELSPEEKGTIQLLWETFGGTFSEQGYRILDSHIGLLYGDAITLERADAISAKLAQNGFASTNVVFGIGLSLAPSYSNVC